MSYLSAGAKKETELEKLHKATLRRKAYFESFKVGDRVEVTTGSKVNEGQICLAYPKFIAVIFDDHSYKTTLSCADYLTGRFRIKKLEGGSQMARMARKIEVPSKEELEAKLLSHQGNINKLAKELGVAWSTAKSWLNKHGLTEVSRSLVKDDQSEVVEVSAIKDSGTRREFDSGAVRDMQEGRGRCDLLPPLAILRLARHFEAGCKKYGDRNWERGIPINSFVDSGIRHILKYMAGETDEDHLVAAAWNLMCAMETEEKRGWEFERHEASGGNE